MTFLVERPASTKAEDCLLLEDNGQRGGGEAAGAERQVCKERALQGLYWYAKAPG